MKNLKIVVAVLLACSFMAFCMASECLAADPIGFIYLPRLLKESKMGKAAQEKIEKTHQRKLADIDAKIAEVETMKQELEKKAPFMTQAEKDKKAAELQKVYSEYEDTRKKAQDELNQMNQELILSVLKTADPIVARIARARGYCMVVKDASVVGFMEPRVDITEEVIKELDRQQPPK